MPNAKLIQSIGGDTGVTVYAIIKCVSGANIGKYLNDADGTFVTPAPADPYATLTEDGTIKGLYSLNESRAVWTDGVYRAISYTQAGGSPAPATDTPRSIQEIVIQTDVEINLNDVDTEVDALRADYTTTRATRIDNLDAAISSRSTYAGGAVASVTAAVTVGANNDKTGYALSAAGVQAIWDALSSALTTAGSIGKRIVDYLTGDSYARLGAPTGVSVSADVAAVKAKTDNLPDGVKKNTALLNFTFLMVDSADGKTGKTGLAITAQRLIDGGVFAACANTAAEVSYGLYKIDLAASDLNGDVVTLRFTATNAIDRDITILTRP